MAMLDEQAISSGVSSLELMERAGGVVVDAIREIVSITGASAQKIIVLCGPGNNGGDGLVIARRLADDGFSVLAVLADAARYSPECRAQLTAFPYAVALEGSGEVAQGACGGRMLSRAEFLSRLADSSIVVDALLGTGQRSAPRGGVGELVTALSSEKQRRPGVIVVSVDIPTGVDADTGALYSPHIVADHTISIELVKRGMLQFPGRAACGAIRVVPIGIDRREGIEFGIIERGRVPTLKRRAPNTHKGAQGRVLAIGGSAAMPGASALAVLGALRSGSGLVSRVTKPTWVGVDVAPECMNVVLSSSEPHYVEDDCAKLGDAIAAADVVVLGPGLGRSPETAEFVRSLLNSLRLEKKRCVIDADALGLIAMHRIELKGIQGVITPHPGEASMLLGISTDEVQMDRFAAVKKLYERYGVVSLLKGAGTLVWDGQRGGIIARGTPYLATAGSGDVLAGIIATCLNRIEEVFESTVCGAYIHAVAGERATRLSGGPIIASDVAWASASVVGELER
jgi:NAD(P)H-hydrate epimerase